MIRWPGRRDWPPRRSAPCSALPSLPPPEQAAGEQEFFARLRSAGVLVRERFSELNPGEVTGYAVALPGCTGPDGTPRWHGGGRLHDSLTLPRLRQGWAAGQQDGGAFRGVPVHCSGTRRDLPARRPAGRRRGGAPAALHRR